MKILAYYRATRIYCSEHIHTCTLSHSYFLTHKVELIAIKQGGHTVLTRYDLSQSKINSQDPIGLTIDTSTVKALVFLEDIYPS